MKVKEVMTSGDLKYCNPETKLHTAAKIMKESNCGALPVLNREKGVVGIITDRDICLTFAQKKPASLAKTKVSEVMQSKVRTVAEEDNVQVALKEMRTQQIGRLPVTNKSGKLTGVLSLHGLLNKSLGNGKLKLGDGKESDESILKTIKSVTDRYNGQKITVKTAPTRKKAKQPAM